MSKRQADSTLEAFVSLATLAAQHPEATKAAFTIIDALGAATYDLTTAALDYLFPRKPIAFEPEPQPLPPYVDEQEAFTPAPAWPLVEDRPVGLAFGCFPAYDERPGIFRL